MKKTKQILLAGLSAVLIAGTLAACGGEKPSPETSETSETAAPEINDPYNTAVKNSYTMLGDNIYMLSYNEYGKPVNRAVMDFHRPTVMLPTEEHANRYIYDENGKLTEYRYEGTALKIETDKNGNPASAKGFFENGTYIEIEFTCDEKGNIVGETFTQGQKPYGRTTWSYFYDSDGRLEKVLGKYKISSVSSEKQKEYTVEYKNGVPYTTVTDEYGNSERNVYLTLDGDGKPKTLNDAVSDTALYTWEYSADGKLLSSEGISPLGWFNRSNKVSAVLKYDEGGHLTEYQLLMEGSDKLEASSLKYEYEYENGSLAKSTQISHPAEYSAGNYDKEDIRVETYKDGVLQSTKTTAYELLEDGGRRLMSVGERVYNGLESNSEYLFYDKDGNVSSKSLMVYRNDELGRSIYSKRTQYNANGEITEEEEHETVYHDDGYVLKVIDYSSRGNTNGFPQRETKEYTSDGELYRKIIELNDVLKKDGLIEDVVSEILYKTGEVPIKTKYRSYYNGELAMESQRSYTYVSDESEIVLSETYDNVEYEIYCTNEYGAKEKRTYSSSYTYSGESEIIGNSKASVYVNDILRSEEKIEYTEGGDRYDGFFSGKRPAKEELLTYDGNGKYLGKQITTHKHGENNYRTSSNVVKYDAEGIKTEEYVILYDENGNTIK